MGDGRADHTIPPTRAVQLPAMLRREAAKDNGKGQYGSVGRCYCFRRTWSCLGLFVVVCRAYVRDPLGRFYPRLVRASFSIETRAARASSGVPTGAGNARRTGRGASAVMADISNP